MAAAADTVQQEAHCTAAEPLEGDCNQWQPLSEPSPVVVFVPFLDTYMTAGQRLHRTYFQEPVPTMKQRIMTYHCKRSASIITHVSI